MENENTVMTDIKVNETGKVSFAPDVIATIANLAASDVEGVTLASAEALQTALREPRG